MNRKEVLDAAESCICVDREGQYGKPEDNFQTIANLWNDYMTAAYPGQAFFVQACDVAMMLALLKVARVATGKPKADNYVDLIGYAACACELVTNTVYTNE